MSDTDKFSADELQRIQFCAEMSHSERAILADLITPVAYQPNSIVFRAGEPANACYLVDQGLVSLEICAAGVGCRRVITVGPGELLGWSPFLSGACFTATARAIEFSQLMCIDAQGLRTACEQDHQFGYRVLSEVIKTLASRINASRLQLLDMFGPETMNSSGA